MKMLLTILGSLAGVAVLAASLGALLPRRHTARAERAVPASPACVWEVITDVERMAEWRTGVARFERVPDEGGLPGWVEHGRHRPLALRVTRWEPPAALVTRISGADAPFSGEWAYTLEARDGGTLVSITETGDVPNPVFRLVGRFVLGWEATMLAYLDDLERRVSEVCGASTDSQSGAAPPTDPASRSE